MDFPELDLINKYKVDIGSGIPFVLQISGDETTDSNKSQFSVDSYSLMGATSFALDIQADYRQCDAQASIDQEPMRDIFFASIIGAGMLEAAAVDQWPSLRFNEDQHRDDPIPGKLG